MKKLLLALLFVSLTAQAESYSRNNAGGGLIVLTDTVCPNFPYLKWMYTTSPTGQTSYGCWAFINGVVHVAYDDGTKYTYPAEAFRKNSY